MPNIVALIDGSEYTNSVCDIASFFAKRLDASIDLVHVLGRNDQAEQGNNLSGSIGLGARTSLLEELAKLDGQRAKLAQQHGRAILDMAKEHLVQLGHSRLGTKLRNAELVETVNDYESEADLIVIGKRGLGAEQNTLHLGSNLERVVRSSQKPVVVASRVVKPIKRLLIAFDGGNSAWKAVEYAVAFNSFSDVECHLITAGDKQNSNMSGLERAAASLIDAGYTVKMDVLSGQPETAISEKVESDSIDLLLMGAYGHSRIRNLIIGSTTTEMIRSCKIPVLLFR